MLPGESGLIPIPMNIAGSEMRMIDELMVAIRIPKVVLVSATHLYRSGWAFLNRDKISLRSRKVACVVRFTHYTGLRIRFKFHNICVR